MQVLLFLVSIFIPIAHAEFSDVPEHNPFHTSISFFEERGAIEGHEDGTFRAHEKVSRAEMATILLRGFSEKRCTFEKQTFSDVKPDDHDWFEPYVCAATEKKIINGYPDGTFKPFDSVTLAEAAAMIDRGFLLEGSAHSDGLIWYKEGVADLLRRGAIPSSVSNVHQELNRGEVMEILYRIFHTDRSIVEGYPDSPLEKAYDYFPAYNDYSYPWRFEDDSSPYYEDIMPIKEHLAIEHPFDSRHYVRILSTGKDRNAANSIARKKEAWVLPTNLTQNLTPNLYAVVKGPFATINAEDGLDHNSYQSGYYSSYPKDSYVKDVGAFLWPETYPFDQKDYPPGLLQAIAGLVGEDSLQGLKSDQIYWSENMINWLCGPTGPAYTFSFTADPPVSIPLLLEDAIDRFHRPAYVKDVTSAHVYLNVVDAGLILETMDWSCWD